MAIKERKEAEQANRTNTARRQKGNARLGVGANGDHSETDVIPFIGEPNTKKQRINVHPLPHTTEPNLDKGQLESVMVKCTGARLPDTKVSETPTWLD